MDGLIESCVKDLLARERHIEEAQRLCRNMQSQIDALHDSLLPSPTNNPAPQADVLRTCGPQPPRHPPCEGPAADIVDVSVSPPPRQRVKPRLPPRSTIPPGATSAERMLGALGEWFQAGSGHEDLVRRNRSLLKLWKKCAVECAWDSWSTLPQDWKERFLSWGNRHISDINHTNLLCFSALTGGWEDFISNTCCVTAAWGLNAFSAPATMDLFVPFVNRPFESEIHGTVNFTQFCCVLLVTWCYRVLLSCYLRPK